MSITPSDWVIETDRETDGRLAVAVVGSKRTPYTLYPADQAPT